MTRGAPPANKNELIEKLLAAVREGVTLKHACEDLDLALPQRKGVGDDVTTLE